MQGTDFKERDCMSFDGFAICIRMDIQKMLGGGYAVEEKSIAKNNGTARKAVLIMKDGSNICPTIYLEGFYEAYRDGESLQDIECSVLRAYQENVPERNFDTSLFTDWQKVKGRVIFKLVNFDRNRELLENVPHRRFLDLAIVYECFLGADNAGGATILIHDSYMEMWGITVDELHDTAVRNTPELMGCALNSMEKVMREIMGIGKAVQDGMEEPGTGICPMYVLTNRHNIHGAGCILYENLLKETAEKWGCDICILPSSIHETILIPMKGEAGCAGMSQMVREVNETQVMPEEILSDHAYQYVRETGKIIMQEEERI